MNTQTITLELSDAQLEAISGGCYRSCDDSNESRDWESGESEYDCGESYEKDECGSYGGEEKYGSCHKPRRFRRHHRSCSW